MQIDKVQLPVLDLDRAVEFYRSLDLVVRPAEHGFEVSIGRSVLALHEGDPGPGVFHCAWTIPANLFDEAKAWLRGKVDLLDRNGQDEFALDGPWHSRSIYFSGPDDILLELIARYELPDADAERFGAPDLVGISEIGISVSSVPAALTVLRDDLGLPVFGSGADDFTPVGDHHGLLIVVRDGRLWFPTEEHAPSRAPLVIHFDGDRVLRTTDLRSATARHDDSTAHGTGTA